ncbi:MAG: hypothetical protein ACXWZY_02945 [Gaiellaceae bacterium]
MAKRVDHAKAKAARQKKIAIGLGVLLLAVVAFQGPKTLKMLKGPSAPVAAATTTSPVAPAPAVTPGSAPASAVAPAVAPGGNELAVLASSDVPAAADAGQLLSFELFENKDPFVQQVDANAPVAAAPTDAGSGAMPDTAPAPAATENTEPAGTEGGSDDPAGETDPTPFETAPAPATETTISVNGNAEPVAEGKTFPTADPVFVLVSIASDGTAVEIGIAGGEYADGEDTITLKLGKPLTLQNTADGSRYELKLITVAGFAPPAAKKK